MRLGWKLKPSLRLQHPGHSKDLIMHAARGRVARMRMEAGRGMGKASRSELRSSEAGGCSSRTWNNSVKCGQAAKSGRAGSAP